MASQRVILFCCGSYNPPTYFHLRIYETARDYLNQQGRFKVIGGIFSPVHDGYGKKDLMAAPHRVEMAKRALSQQSFVKLSTWESSNPQWTPTRQVVDYHQNRLDAYLSGQLSEADPWMPDNLSRDDPTPLKCKLLCGADVIQSFNTPHLWKDDDMLTLARDYGIVVISRSGNDPHKSVYDSDILSAHEGNIFIVREWFENKVSSTGARIAIRRGQSVKYIVPEPVIEYIKEQGLYR